MAGYRQRAAIQKIDQRRITQHQSIGMKISSVRCHKFCNRRRHDWYGRHDYRIEAGNAGFDLYDPARPGM